MAYSGDFVLREFANEFANLDKEFESVCAEEKFNPFSPRQRKIFEQRDRLYQKVAEHIEQKILSKHFNDIIPFFQTEISSFKNLTLNMIRDFLSNNTQEKSSIQKELFLFMIDYSKDDHGLLLLEVCSKNASCCDVLKPHLKELFLTKEIHPFLLDFLPELYRDEDIISLFNFRDEHAISNALNNFASLNQKEIKFNDYFLVTGLLMFARYGNQAAEDTYLSFVASLESVINYNTLAGCAIIASPRSFDVLFEKLNDFRRYSYSGHTVSLAVVSLLDRTITDFPSVRGKWLFREYSMQNDAKKYIDWVKNNKDSYTLRALTPFDLFSLLFLHFRA